MPPKGTTKAVLKFTPLLGAKIVGCLILSLLGMYYLYKGREDRDFGSMVKGAVLVLLSFFLFV